MPRGNLLERAQVANALEHIEKGTQLFMASLNRHVRKAALLAHIGLKSAELLGKYTFARCVKPRPAHKGKPLRSCVDQNGTRTRAISTRHPIEISAANNALLYERA